MGCRKSRSSPELRYTFEVLRWRYGAVLLWLLLPTLLASGCSSTRDENCNDNSCICSGGGCQCRDEPKSCDLECEKDCALTCDKDHDCDFKCGAGCSVACDSEGNCSASVGSGSSVTCSGAQGCNVHCSDTCTVVCQTKKPCAVTCKLRPALSCPGNVIVCGDSC